MPSLRRKIAYATIGVLGTTYAAITLPAMAEGAKNSCHALEKKAVSSLVDLTKREDGVDLREGFGLIFLGVMNAAVDQSGGSLAKAKAEQVAGGIPPNITCSARWWVAALGGGDALANEIRDEVAKTFDEQNFNF